MRRLANRGQRWALSGAMLGAGCPYSTSLGGSTKGAGTAGTGQTGRAGGEVVLEAGYSIPWTTTPDGLQPSLPIERKKSKQ